MSPLEPPVHIQQVALGYCLPACAQMALAQLSIAATQAQLAQVLGTRAGIRDAFFTGGASGAVERPCAGGATGFY